MTREEAIEVVKKNWPDSNYTSLREALETLIPDIRESEDERIRKFLLRLAERCSENSIDFMGEIKKKDVIAYLEKQKEQKPRIEICPHSTKSKSYKENGYPIEDCDYGLEIAYDILEKTFGEVQGYKTDDGLREHQTAIEAVRKAKEKKPVKWGDDDEERLINTSISFLKDFADKGYENAVECIDWLKSLRPSWKPSEEQMNSLLNAEGKMRALRFIGIASNLAKLYEQLKAIKEDGK